MSKLYDSSHTSVKLRNKALELIRKTGRPMAATEIIDYLREHNPQLWDSINQKCDNYVRIILNLTRGSALLKYKPLKPIYGIDKRTSFFGLANVNYPSEQWIRFVPNTGHRKETAKVPPKEQILTIKTEEAPKPKETKQTQRNELFESLNSLFEDVFKEEDNMFSSF